MCDRNSRTRLWVNIVKRAIPATDRCRPLKGSNKCPGVIRIPGSDVTLPGHAANVQVNFNCGYLRHGRVWPGEDNDCLSRRKAVTKGSGEKCRTKRPDFTRDKTELTSSERNYCHGVVSGGIKRNFLD